MEKLVLSQFNVYSISYIDAYFLVGGEIGGQGAIGLKEWSNPAGNSNPASWSGFYTVGGGPVLSIGRFWGSMPVDSKEGFALVQSTTSFNGVCTWIASPLTGVLADFAYTKKYCMSFYSLNPQDLTCASQVGTGQGLGNMRYILFTGCGAGTNRHLYNVAFDLNTRLPLASSIEEVIFSNGELQVMTKDIDTNILNLGVVYTTSTDPRQYKACISRFSVGGSFSLMNLNSNSG